MKTYKWLTAPIPEGQDQRIDKVLHGLDNKKWLPWKKDLYATYYLNQLETHIKNGQMSKFNLALANVNAWTKEDSFKELEQTFVQNVKGKFQTSGVIIVMMATLVTFFMYEVFAQNYMFNFSVDAIIGVLAAVVLYVNLRAKYRMIAKWTQSKDFVIIDTLCVIMVILLRTVLPALDFSLIVYAIGYFVQKKKFDVFMYK